MPAPAAVGILVSLFEALGLATRFARFAAFFQKVFRVGQRTLANKFAKWFAGVVGAALKYEDGFEFLHDIIKDEIYKHTGIDIDEMTRDNIIEAAGRAAADEVGQKIYDRYGLDFPIENLASETVAEDLGYWFADLANAQLSQTVGYEVSPFTTFMPLENIPNDLDVFVSDAMSNALGVQITSILDVQNLKTELTAAFFKVMTDAVNEGFNAIQSEIHLAVEQLIYSSNIPETARPAVQALVIEVLNKYAVDVNNLLPENIRPKKFYFSPDKRLKNKLRQRRYRKTHKQLTTWVEREQPTETAVVSILHKISSVVN